MRERKEKVNPPREIPSTSEDYLSPPGGGSLSPLAARFLPLSISHRLVSRQLHSRRSSPPFTERRAHGSLKILYFIVTARSSGIPVSLPSKRLSARRLSNGRFEFA